MLIPFKSVPFPRRRQHNLYSRAAGELGSSIEVSTGILNPSHSLFQLFTSRQPSWKQPANKPSYPVAIYVVWGERGESRWEKIGVMLICAENHGKGRREKNFLAKTTCVKCVKTFAFVLRCVKKTTFLTSNGAFVKKFQSFDLKVKLWAY